MSTANLETSFTSFPFPVRDLESERVKLTVFIPALHGEEFVNKSKDLFTYFSHGPFESVNELVEKLRIIHELKSVLYAILDKTGGTSRLAGTIGLLNTDAVNQSTEIGFVMIFPEFQRTHISTHSIGLLLHYCLELPSELENATGDYATKQKFGPGLGLRRVQWQAHAENIRSARAAERMGFRREGIIRWQRILSEESYGNKVSKERELLCKNPGRHSYMASLCWDDWELEGKREFVRTQMERV